MISPGPLVPVADFGPTDRINGWVMTAIVTALAAVTRFLNLQSPTDAGTPIFDEKHYAPQAWQMLHNGGVEDNPGFGLVVHPPVGKQLIAIGEAIFGYNGLGWRFTGALLGVVMVAIVARTVRRISRSTLVGGIAGVLLIADGVTFVASRTALLDGFQMFFIVAAFGALIVDRDDVRARMHNALLDGRINETPWGPRLGVRWWRFGAGVLLGLACATKWSGPVLRDVLRRDVGGVGRGGPPSVPGAATMARHDPPRRRPGPLRVGADPVRGVSGVLLDVVRVGDRRSTATRSGSSIGERAWYQPPDAIRSLWHYTAKASNSTRA